MRKGLFILFATLITVGAWAQEIQSVPHNPNPQAFDYPTLGEAIRKPMDIGSKFSIKGEGDFADDTLKAGEVADGGIVIMKPNGHVMRRNIAQTDGFHTRWWGALGGATDNTTFLRNAIAAAKGHKLHFDDSVYHIKGTLGLQSHSSYHFNNSRIIQDSIGGTLHAVDLLHDTDIVITGTVRIVPTNPGSNSNNDGFYIDSCQDITIDHIINIGSRFGVQIGHSKNIHIGTVEGYNIKGFQVIPANGGSVCTMFASKDITIDFLYGDHIWKAGLYLSLDASNVLNEGIHIGKVNFKMDTSNVANAVAIRSGRNVNIESIISDGGISGLFLDLNIDSQYVEDIHVNNLMVRNNTILSNPSNALHISSEVSRPVRRVTVDNMKSYNSVRPGILGNNVEDIHIGVALIDSVANDRGVSFDNAKNVSIGDLTVRRTLDGILLSDTIKNFKIGNYRFENLSLAGSGIYCNSTPGFAAVLTDFRASSITGYNDSTRAPFGYVFNYGNPPSTERLDIGKITYKNGSGILWKGKAFSNITNGVLWASNPPTANTNYWSYGDIIYNDSLTNQPEQGWRNKAGGMPGNWERIDKVWGISDVLNQNPVNTTQNMTFVGRSFNIENPLNSGANKGIGFSDNNITRFLLFRDVTNGGLTLSEFNRSGTLISTVFKVDSLGNMGFNGISTPQKPNHFGKTVRMDDSLLLFNLPVGTTTDSLLSITTGRVVRKVAYPAMFWQRSGKMVSLLNAGDSLTIDGKLKVGVLPTGTTSMKAVVWDNTDSAFKQVSVSSLTGTRASTNVIGTSQSLLANFDVYQMNGGGNSTFDLGAVTGNFDREVTIMNYMSGFTVTVTGSLDPAFTTATTIAPFHTITFKAMQGNWKPISQF